MAYQLPSTEEVNAVDLTWKRYLLPKIHPEGVKILLGEVVIIVALSALCQLFQLVELYLLAHILSSIVGALGLPLLVFSFYFFRNPNRVPPKGESLIVSPADGVVSNIKEMVPPAELGLGSEPLIRVSIFMSVFSVHVNRAPVAGTVTDLKYIPGKFVSVQDKDSDDNERQLIGVTMADGKKVGFIQIAGLVARRIYCPLKVGDAVKAGEVFGMIRFGSRLDVFLPKGVVPKVQLNQTSLAGETILADMAEQQ